MGFSASNRLTVQLTSVKLDTLIRLTHRKVSLELIYHSYNYKHYQHIAYVNIFYGLLRTFSSGPLRFCQQKSFSSFLLFFFLLHFFLLHSILFYFICLYFFLLYPPEASGGFFGLAFTMPPPPVERFSALTL